MMEFLLTQHNLAEELPWFERLHITPTALGGFTEFDRSAVAVIGNGAFDRVHGPEIDAFPTVVRFNAFKTKGFEDLVGSKTTIHVLNSQNLGLALEDCENHVYLLIDTCTPGKMYEFYFANVCRIRGLRIIRPSSYQQLGRLLNGRYKTQGFFFTELARLHFSAVTIAGFSGHAHYFNPNWKMYTAHPLEAEHRKYTEWESDTFRQLR